MLSERRARAPARRRSAGAEIGQNARDLLRQVYEKAGQDKIFFMAGAIAFNMLIAIVPFILAVIGIAAIILRGQHSDPGSPLVDWMLGNVPPVSADFERELRELARNMIASTTSFVGVGTLLFVWFATRLVGTLRTTLREVFDIQFDLGIIRGKIYDIQMVLAAGTLFALNIGLTILAEIVTRFGTDITGLRPVLLPFAAHLYARLVAFLTIWIMFVLIYRYLPDRRIRWRTAFVAGTFAAALFELMKQGFAWYATNVANYASTYGNLATLAILIFWIYYIAVAFILGGEVAQVVTMQWIRRRQKERLS